MVDLSQHSPYGPRGESLLFLSYDRVASFVDGLAQDLVQSGYAAAVGILRGGAFPAVLASYAASIPVSFLRYDRATRQVTWGVAKDVRPPQQSLLLLCEDFAGSGSTLADCKNFLLEQGYRVDVLAVVYDDHSREQPKFFMDLRGKHVIFPWERHLLGASWNTALEEGNKLEAEHTYQSWGFDLDGVLLPDVSEEAYATDLDAALAVRDTLLPVDLPFTIPPKSFIITARPISDEARTRDWLARNGYGHMPLEMRREATAGPIPAAVHKAEVCVRIGITHFVESDPVQAIEISALVPWLRVLNWNSVDQRARWITAVADDVFVDNSVPNTPEKP